MSPYSGQLQQGGEKQTTVKICPNRPSQVPTSIVLRYRLLTRLTAVPIRARMAQKLDSQCTEDTEQLPVCPPREALSMCSGCISRILYAATTNVKQGGSSSVRELSVSKHDAEDWTLLPSEGLSCEHGSFPI